MITHTFTLEAMAMPFTVKLKATPAMGLSVQRVATYRQLIQQELDRLDHEFSPFRPDSLVRRFARQELTAAQLTRDFQTVYGWAVRAQDQTAGAFNPFFAGHYDPTGLVKGWAIQRVFEQYLRPTLTRGDLVAAAINGAGDVQTGVAPGSAFSGGSASKTRWTRPGPPTPIACRTRPWPRRAPASMVITSSGRRRPRSNKPPWSAPP
ncbi:FAD:protein FMN transferase [Levilactobacillus zymae]|uniref:FAD:protein FMN transferase n=1 Tax=Levilactobacillus zymae TaxID=267363 RepID=UPI000B403D95|nr:FAD:protein FMN transferase [Levilactobacillus zymae]